MAVGFSRPIQLDGMPSTFCATKQNSRPPTDLWELPPNRRTAHLTTLVQNIFYSRCHPDKRPDFLRREETSSDVGHGRCGVGLTVTASESMPDGKQTAANALKYDSSLFKSLHTAFFYRWWIAGIFYLSAGKCCLEVLRRACDSFVSDTLRTTTPLVTKVLLNWLTESYEYHLADKVKGPTASVAAPQPRGIGYGIGLALALFAMQQIASLVCRSSASSSTR